MDSEQSFASIDVETFGSLLEEYPNVLPDKLSELDTHRYEQLPDSIASRNTIDGAYLNKDELAALVDWKLCVPHSIDVYVLSVDQNTARMASFVRL